MSGVLEQALRYADRGYPVLPCCPRGKQPITKRGLRDASLDPGLIAGWFERRPDANVAIRTGAASGLLVLDVDGDDGYESLRALQREHAQLPCTATVVTPRGGQHIYFRHPGGTVANSAGRLGAHLDVRGDGGYILAPPSVGANGRRYEPDERAPLADPPGWLLGLLRGSQAAPGRGCWRCYGSGVTGTGRECGCAGRRPSVPAREWVALVRDGAAAGARNSELARLVGHLLAKDVDAHLVAELAQLVNGRCRPPLEAHEVDRIMGSIAGREVRRRGAGGRA